MWTRSTKAQKLPVRLYTTAYHNCNITRLQPQGNNRHAVFLVTESEAITYNYELDLRQAPPSPDPRIAHTLNLRFDEYGRALQSVAVVYPTAGSLRRPPQSTSYGATGTDPESSERAPPCLYRDPLHCRVGPRSAPAPAAGAMRSPHL